MWDWENSLVQSRLFAGISPSNVDFELSFSNDCTDKVAIVRSKFCRLGNYLAALGAFAFFEVHVVALKSESRGWPPPASSKKSSVKKTRRSPERPTRAA
jgi:hypothetical protein